MRTINGNPQTRFGIRMRMGRKFITIKKKSWAMFKFEREVDLDIEKSFLKVSQKLKDAGFVVLSYVDIKEIIKNKFGEDFPGYYILDVCKPAAAKELISSNHDYGLFLPCKVTLESKGEGKTIVKMLLVSELAENYLKADPSRPRAFEAELKEAINSL